MDQSRRMLRGALFALAVSTLPLFGAPSDGHAETPHRTTPAPDAMPGATLESVLAIAKQLSPQLTARALEEEAARARVKVAGSLPDPLLRITSDEIDRLSGPRQNKMIYSIEQDIPLWGKRTLRREAAEAVVSQKAAEARDGETELTERVKVTFAVRYQTFRALQANRELRPLLASVAQAARDRYAQNLVSSSDAGASRSLSIDQPQPKPSGHRLYVEWRNIIAAAVLHRSSCVGSEQR